MADNQLADSLGDLNFVPLDTSWGIGAQSIAQALPSLVNPYASPWSNLGVTLGGALVASLLGYQARKEANDMSLQTQRYANQMLRMQTPEARTAFLAELPSEAAGTGVASKLSRLSTALGRQETLQNALIQQEVARAKALAPIEVDLARAKELGVGFGQLGEMDKQRAAARSTLLGALSPTAPATGEGMPTPVLPSAADTLTNPEAYKVLTKPEREALAARQKLDEAKQQQADALRKEFTALPEVKNFSLIDTAAKVVSQAVKDPSSVATQELVRRAVQLIEPGMAVREGEQAAIMASQSIPDQFKGEISRALNGEGGLAAETREGIMRIAERAYKTQAEKYKTTKDYYEGLAKERQLPPKSISYLGEPTNWDSIVGKPAGSKMDALQSILRELQTTSDPTKIADLKRQASEIYKGQ